MLLGDLCGPELTGLELRKATGARDGRKLRKTAGTGLCCKGCTESGDFRAVSYQLRVLAIDDALAGILAVRQRAIEGLDRYEFCITDHLASPLLAAA